MQARRMQKSVTSPSSFVSQITLKSPGRPSPASSVRVHSFFGKLFGGGDQVSLQSNLFSTRALPLVCGLALAFFFLLVGNTLPKKANLNRIKDLTSLLFYADNGCLSKQQQRIFFISLGGVSCWRCCSTED